MNKIYLKIILFIQFFLLCSFYISAHPAPDIPVRSYFWEDIAKISIEVETRAVADNFDEEAYLLKEDFDKLNNLEKQKLIDKVEKLILETISINLDPIGKLKQVFKFKFEKQGGGELKNPKDIVVLNATQTVILSGQEKRYQIESLPENKLSLVVMNYVNNILDERVHTLFPTEKSYLLELKGLRSITDASFTKESASNNSNESRWFTFFQFLRQGFDHIIPKGLDHIYFILGLFLFSRKWRPLITQISMFTVAHTVTLGMTVVGLINLSPSIVEPIIAASLAFVALENIFRPEDNRFRLFIVMLFGLIHGMGFAGALMDLNLPSATLITGLLGFNIGVEVGQLSVIFMAYALTFWIKNESKYRLFIVIPSSLIIALIGIWWTISRIFIL